MAKYSNNILLHFGGGSIKASGLYDRVTASLKKAGVNWVELGGVKPNPRLSLVHEGVKLCKEHNLGLILAVGGGSVIDSAKAIAMGAVIEGDVWDFFLGKGTPVDCPAHWHSADHSSGRQRSQHGNRHHQRGRLAQAGGSTPS